MKVYLAGAINKCSDEEACDWRDKAVTLLEIMDIETLNPMSRDYRGLEKTNYKSIVVNDKADIDGCSILLVYYSKPSVGTSMEILYAWERNKYIICIAEDRDSLSPWILFHAHEIVPTLNAALKRIINIQEQ